MTFYISLQDCEEVFRYYETEYAKMLERWEKVYCNKKKFISRYFLTQIENMFSVFLSSFSKTNENAAIWWAELLVYYQPLECSGCRQSTKWPRFFCIPDVFQERLNSNRWGSRDGAAVRALASHQCVPGSILARFHMWVELVVGSRPCSAGFSLGSPVFLPPQKLTLQIPIWPG